MSSLRLTLSTGVLAAAAALAPAPAHATDGGRVQVSPSSPAPGGAIALRGTGCPGRTGTAASEAFVSAARLTVADDGALAGETQLRSTVRPGPYDVRIVCGEKLLKTRFTVGLAASADPTASTAPDASAAADPAAPVAPDASAVPDPAASTAPESSAALDPAAPVAPASPAAPDRLTPTAPASPTAPVRAGGGGTAHLAAVDTGSTGPGAAHTVTGLLLAAGAAVAVMTGRARRGRKAG
ncbi:hypothetical protein [Streptomyces sp. JB150]|uniref:hypothetical protein n=1 Tax=Streptomyces sp. JB150 TaxID=2714844 RepID=UPI00140CF369|nr:hypothetical protein [Streptomyces sp. JB150]QIJ62863.1 hypothetical protein G7Z13_13060 [Streptomyces sp. JB150]